MFTYLHLSCNTCHMSHVICHMYLIKKNGLSGEYRRWRVCYKRCLPRQVYILFTYLLAYIYLFSPIAVLSGKSHQVVLSLTQE